MNGGTDTLHRQPLPAMSAQDPYPPWSKVFQVDGRPIRRPLIHSAARLQTVRLLSTNTTGTTTLRSVGSTTRPGAHLKQPTLPLPMARSLETTITALRQAQSMLRTPSA